VQVALPHYRSPAFLRKAAARYLVFLDLHKQNLGEFLVPYYDIDLIWHAHQARANLWLDREGEEEREDKRERAKDRERGGRTADRERESEREREREREITGNVSTGLGSFPHLFVYVCVA
jgi:hypothetical protein